MSPSKLNKDESINWRCQNYYKKGNLKCTATCTTRNNELIREPSSHNHEPVSRARIKLHEVLYDIKQVAPEQNKGMKRLFDEITQETISQHNEHGIALEEFAQCDFTFKNFKSTLYKIRHEQMPRLPKALNEINLQNEVYSTTNTKRRFLLSHTNNDLIIFASEYQLEILSQAERWHIDGTFKVRIYSINSIRFMLGFTKKCTYAFFRC